ncbi:MAG: hypothetical protein LH466_08210 [Sphingomonas bacterium]|nr:hypothetical protein [Sphingomonas bacterium]
MTERIDWKAVIWAAIIAAIVFMMLEMALVATVGDGSPWGPPRMIAAIVMGKEVLPPPATFEMGPMLVAMLLHLTLSVVFAAILGGVISSRNLNLGMSIIVGTLFGLLLYLMNFYVFTAIWPWFAMARGTIPIFAHAAYGLTLGWVYRALTSQRVKIIEER